MLLEGVDHGNLLSLIIVELLTPKDLRVIRKRGLCRGVSMKDSKKKSWKIIRNGRHRVKEPTKYYRLKYRHLLQYQLED
jgi:hypothetical protein